MTITTNHSLFETQTFVRSNQMSRQIETQLRCKGTKRTRTKKQKIHPKRTKKPSTIVFLSNSYTLQEATQSHLQVKECMFVYTSRYFHINNFVAHKQFKDFTLCDGAIKIRDSENAGGTSIISEALSFEVLYKMFNASLLSTENEIVYYPIGKITDYAVQVSNHENTVTLGVSVTRAMKYKGVFERKDAVRLLEKKLFGVICSSENASYPKFAKQILHIWSIDQNTANILKDVYENEISNYYKHNTIVIITVSKNTDSLFWEKSSTKLRNF
ncbi:hypothetical protein M0813_25580 [Anaeramoeba flamelloides]|uniref:Uncharacterized protein n=1 Tax=Anaeramoeba flamelloides TaxID=1746091 RepID=A0ABQ8Y488_9EUKA|nr:hypothetical protein M0813_25580 [Anaeramoeba flamelloides]